MKLNGPIEEHSKTWQDAVNSFLSSLGPAERDAFQTPASPDDCMAVLLATQRRKTKLARILSLIRPVIGPLKRFEGAIDVIVQIVITLSADHFRTLESIAMIIHRIISSLQRFSKYEELFENNRLVQDAIGALYCDYLDFCVRVTKFYSASPFRAFFSSFDKDFQDISENIQLHGQNVDWAAHAAHVEETQRESDYLPHSCDEILISEQFQSLVSSDNIEKPHILSLQGLPGSGKTITAALIIDHLKTKGFDVLHFFFKANDVEKRSLSHCARTILSQLIRLEEHLYNLVEPFYQESGRVVADSLSEVLRALSTAFEHSKSNRIFVILDALDESSDGHSQSKQVRILNTCRPSSSLLQSSTTWSLLRMGNLEAKSINTYIYARVQKNPVADHVASAAQGLWLYARLMMDDIDRLPSIGQIQRQLTVLPKGFTELYTQIIRTAEANYNPIELKLAQQLHLWIDTTDYVPKFLMLELIFQYANSGEAVHDPGSVAHRVSGPLISVTNSQAYDLDFIHHTAARYLRSSNSLPASHLPLMLRPRRLRHLHRAAVAIWYFSECAQSAEMLSYLQQTGGRPSRSIITALHLSTFPPIEDPQEASEAAVLLQTLTEFIETSKCLRWIECAIIINYKGKFPHLLYNAVDGWKAAKKGVEDRGAFAPWLAFSEARVRFFRNYALVLATTGLGRESAPREILDARLEDIMDDELAHAILLLGLRWRKLAFPGADEMDLCLD
ncbi:hypothetical protein F4805DRAFT_468530 [Annulohypoxylon moriforme]|nr:hypothetical protein F4805DRAFT_468530 [Annulohypoxylon moriforme]